MKTCASSVAAAPRVVRSARNSPHSVFVRFRSSELEGAQERESSLFPTQYPGALHKVRLLGKVVISNRNVFLICTRA